MKVGKSVRLALEDFDRGEYEASMLHACNAVDGTAAKLHGRVSGKQRQRFLQTVRDAYPIISPTAMGGLDLNTWRFPFKQAVRSSTQDGMPDLADIIYGVHRCAHGHGDELQNGYQLVPDFALASNKTSMHMADNVAMLSDRCIFGLLFTAVLSPANADQRTGGGEWLSFADRKFLVDEWWGRTTDFLTFADTVPKGTLIIWEFG